MWLNTTIGFFSLTETPTNRGILQLRARRKGDLDQFLAHASVIGRNPDENDDDKAARDEMNRIVFTPQADYRWRILFPRRFGPLVLTVLFQTISYDNFKDEMSRTPHQRDKMHELHAIWALCRLWQDREPLPQRQRPPAAGPRIIKVGGQQAPSTLPPGGHAAPKPGKRRKEHRARRRMTCSCQGRRENCANCDGTGTVVG